MEQERNGTFILGDRAYDFVKKLVQVILPALGALYFGLAQIWGLPNAEQVLGTVLCIQTFLGVCLGISTAQYNASGRAFMGQLTVQKEPGGEPVVTGLNIDANAEDISKKSALTIKVKHEVPVSGDAVVIEEDDEDISPPTPPHKARAKKKPQ